MTINTDMLDAEQAPIWKSLLEQFEALNNAIKLKDPVLIYEHSKHFERVAFRFYLATD